MARPRIPKTMHRTTDVKTYWTQDEYEELRRLACAARLSVSSYIRHLVLGESLGRKIA